MAQIHAPIPVSVREGERSPLLLDAQISAYPGAEATESVDMLGLPLPDLPLNQMRDIPQKRDHLDLLVSKLVSVQQVNLGIDFRSRGMTYHPEEGFIIPDSILVEPHTPPRLTALVNGAWSDLNTMGTRTAEEASRTGRRNIVEARGKVVKAFEDVLKSRGEELIRLKYGLRTE